MALHPIDGTDPQVRDADEAVLMLYEERADVSKRVKDVCVVRASSVTQFNDHVINEELATEQVDVTHVPIGRYVADYPPVRVDGDTTILPIVEEVLVVERRLLLKEEVHIKKVRTTKSYTETVVLREQHAVISRDSAPLSQPID